MSNMTREEALKILDIKDGPDLVLKKNEHGYYAPSPEGKARLKSAYKAKALLLHPDKLGPTTEFQQLNEANQLLGTGDGKELPSFATEKEPDEADEETTFNNWFNFKGTASVATPAQITAEVVLDFYNTLFHKALNVGDLIDRNAFTLYDYTRNDVCITHLSGEIHIDNFEVNDGVYQANKAIQKMPPGEVVKKVTASLIKYKFSPTTFRIEHRDDKCRIIFDKAKLDADIRKVIFDTARLEHYTGFMSNFDFNPDNPDESSPNRLKWGEMSIRVINDLPLVVSELVTRKQAENMVDYAYMKGQIDVARSIFPISRNRVNSYEGIKIYPSGLKPGDEGYMGGERVWRVGMLGSFISEYADNKRRVFPGGEPMYTSIDDFETLIAKKTMPSLQVTTKTLPLLPNISTKMTTLNAQAERAVSYQRPDQITTKNKATTEVAEVEPPRRDLKDILTEIYEGLYVVTQKLNPVLSDPEKYLTFKDPKARFTFITKMEKLLNDIDLSQEKFIEETNSICRQQKVPLLIGNNESAMMVAIEQISQALSASHVVKSEYTLSLLKIVYDFLNEGKTLAIDANAVSDEMCQHTLGADSRPLLEGFNKLNLVSAPFAELRCFMHPKPKKGIQASTHAAPTRVLMATDVVQPLYTATYNAKYNAKDDDNIYRNPPTRRLTPSGTTSSAQQGPKKDQKLLPF